MTIAAAPTCQDVPAAPPILAVAAPARAALPHEAGKRQVQAAMRGFAVPDDRLGYGIAIADGAATVALFWLSWAAPWLWLKLALVPVLGLFLGRLWVLAHDADHGALVSSRRGNRVIAYLLFLPGLMPPAAWSIGHAAHHACANVLAVDPSVCPLSPAEYRATTATRRWLERQSRRPFGQGLFIAAGFLRITLKPIFGLNWSWRRPLPPLVRDAMATLLALVVMLALAALVAVLSGGSVVANLMLGVALPLAAWFSLSGLIAYLQHNDPEIGWYRNSLTTTWTNYGISLDGTTVVTLPCGLHRLLHDVMEHVPHHINTRIPCYRLRAAREALERLVPPGTVQHRHLTWRQYRRVTGICKLFDPALGRWVPFPPPGSDARVPAAKEPAAKEPAAEVPEAGVPAAGVPEAAARDGPAPQTG